MEKLSLGNKAEINSSLYKYNNNNTNHKKTLGLLV